MVGEADTWAARNGTQFAIIAGPPAVRRAFEVADLSKRLRSWTCRG
jgi:hypothetical protein